MSFEDCSSSKNITLLSDETHVLYNWRKAVQMERNDNRRGILSQVKVDQELIVENKDKLLDKHMAKENNRSNANGAMEKK